MTQLATGGSSNSSRSVPSLICLSAPDALPHSPFAALYLFQAMTHTSRMTCRCSCPSPLCVVFASYAPTLPKFTGVGPSSAIISLTTNIFCASSITLNWCSCSATSNDHAVSLSFNYFASLHLLGVASTVCSAVADRSTTWARIRQPVPAMPRTHDSASFERPSRLSLLAAVPPPARSPIQHLWRFQRSGRQSTPRSL